MKGFLLYVSIVVLSDSCENITFKPFFDLDKPCVCEFICLKVN